MKKYKKIVVDIFLNMIASALPIVTLQLFILPAVSRTMEVEAYGLLLTIISIVTVCSGSLGNALNNIRLIKNTEYEEQGVTGDFPILLIGETLIGIVVVGIAMLKLHLSATDYWLILFLSVIWLLREYYIVFFRIKLLFQGIVMNNLLMVLGYGIGYCFYSYTGYWQFIYIVGIIMSIIYVMCSGTVIHEKAVRTPFFRGTCTDVIVLVVAAGVNSLLTYADRILIYPLIGGAAVSIYYASSLLGKVVGLVMTPFNGVVLSYISKKQTMKRSVFVRIVLITGVIAFVGYFLSRLVAYPALLFLYPNMVEQAVVLLPVTTLVAMIAMMISVINPFVLKFCNIRWQIIINMVVLVIYVSGSLLLYGCWGIMGFCYGVLISNTIKLLIMLIIGYKGIGREDA